MQHFCRERRNHGFARTGPRPVKLELEGRPDTGGHQQPKAKRSERCANTDQVWIEAMSSASLKFAVVIAAGWPQLLCGQTRPMSVCDALNSAADRQVVVIRAAIASTPHQTFLFEGTGRDPCPGWRKRFFTAPSVIPTIFGSYAGVHVPDNLLLENLHFVQHLKSIQQVKPSAQLFVTVKGVLIRKRWPLIFRNSDGIYCCWGEGVDGGSAAVLVVTSTPIEVH
jgi:hypothetical protein